MYSHQLEQSVIDSSNSGCSVCCLIQDGNTAHLSWVGDSRAIVVGSEGKYTVLTKEHKPDEDVERMRIEQSGGRVDRMQDSNGDSVGPPRVFAQASWSLGLNVSRSLGDTYAHKLGVSSEPSYARYRFQLGDECLIIGSKGLWEMMSNEEAAQIATTVLERDTLLAAADAIALKAREKWVECENGRADDITVAILTAPKLQL